MIVRVVSHPFRLIGKKLIRWEMLIPRQETNCFNKIVLNQLLSDFQLGAIIGKCAVGEKETGDTVLRKFRNDVQNPTIVCIAGRRHFVSIPTRIINQFVGSSPFFLIERRVC